MTARIRRHPWRFEGPGSCLAVVPLLVATTLASAQSLPGYRFETVEQPAGGYASLSGLGPGGQIVGSYGHIGNGPEYGDQPWAQLSSGRYRIGTTYGTAGFARAVNASDVVVGSVTDYSATGGARAFRWQAGLFEILDAPVGERAVANDINDAGTVVGYSLTSAGIRATVWDADGTGHLLGTLLGRKSLAYSISEHGVILGFTIRSDGKERAFLQEGGAMHELPGWQNDQRTLGYVINDRGLIVGYTEETVPGPRQAVYWVRGEIRLLPLPGQPYHSYCVAVNNHDQIIGHVRPFDGGVLYDQLFLWQNGETYLLSELADVPSNYEFRNVYAIDDTGRIGGRGAQGDISSFLLTPCLANLNRDPVIDAADRELFWRAFLASDPLADVDGDGNIDLNDAATFEQAFANGC